MAASSARNKAVRRVDAIVRTARPHERSRIQEKAREARAAIERNFGVYAERELSGLCAVREHGESWLDLIIAFCRTVQGQENSLRSHHESRVVAMIVFRQLLTTLP